MGVSTTHYYFIVAGSLYKDPPLPCRDRRSINEDAPAEWCIKLYYPPSLSRRSKKEEEEEDVNMMVSYSIYVNQSLSEENEFSSPTGRK